MFLQFNEVLVVAKRTVTKYIVDFVIAQPYSDSHNQSVVPSVTIYTKNGSVKIQLAKGILSSGKL